MCSQHPDKNDDDEEEDRLIGHILKKQMYSNIAIKFR